MAENNGCGELLMWLAQSLLRDDGKQQEKGLGKRCSVADRRLSMPAPNGWEGAGRARIVEGQSASSKIEVTGLRPGIYFW